MEIPKCLGCRTIQKDCRSKRCRSCAIKYWKSNEWAKTPEEIKRRRKISINNGKSNLGGKIMTEEVRKKIGLAHIGNKYNWKGGLPKCIDCNKKVSVRTAKRCFSCYKKWVCMRLGEKHHHWKGNDIGYRTLHQWVESRLGKPDTCEFCEKNGLKGKQIHWANKSGEYRRNLEDWLRLCVKCHKAYDRHQIILL